MKAFKLLPIAALALVYACSGGSEGSGSGTENGTEPKPAAKAEVCTYSYNDAGTEVLWTAYKYTEKTGVKGVFDEVTVSGTKEGATPAEVLADVTFEIPTASVNSGDATRDPKIKESFFGNLDGGDKLSGRVVSIEGDDSKGKIVFNLAMNGLEQPVEGAYTVEGDKLEVRAEMNVETWSAMPAIQALNKVCEDLHKGADGESILWPDVSLILTAGLTKTCE